MFDFSDQVVVITGALGNLGTATARSFAAAGATLGLLDIRSKDLHPILRVNCCGPLLVILLSLRIRVMKPGKQSHGC